MYCPGKYCFNREKCESLEGYVTTSRSIYVCGKCGDWLFVQRFPFIIEEHVKTTKKTKHAFSLPKKKHLIPNKHLLPNVPFQTTKDSEKKLSVDNNIQETIGDVSCPTCRNGNGVYIFQPIKGLVPTTLKSAKPAATFWIFLLRTRNR